MTEPVATGAWVPDTGEVSLWASPGRIRALAGRLRVAGSAELSATRGIGSWPRRLRGVDVVPTADPMARFSVDEATDRLRIEGDAAAVAFLIGELDALSDWEEGSHSHIEGYPGHPLLREESTPVVVVLRDDP